MENQKRKLLAFILIIVIFTAYLVAGNIITPKVNKHDKLISNEELISIQNVQKGFYNKYLPIFAISIYVEECTDTVIEFQVNYFPFGNIKMAYYRAENPFEITRSLTGIN